jgi:predicted dehydrogenase
MTLPRREFLATVGTAALAAASRADDPKSAKPRIKIGQIGVGHSHATKLAVYRDSADYEVVGIVEPDEALRKPAQAAAPYRDLKWMTRDELLATPGLQAVLVETRILDTAAKKKLLVQMGYMYRYNPAVVMLRDFLKKGWLGEVFEVHAVMSKVVTPAERKRLAQFRGGVMFELGCHVLDLVVGILGAPREVSSVRLHSAKVDDGLFDNMLAVLTYPRASATVKSSAIEVEGGDRRHLVVCGTEGTFHIQPLDNPAARVSLSQARGEYRKGTQDVKFPKYTRYADDAADMAKVIRGEKPTDFPYEHDLAVQETLLKACDMPLK